MCIRDRVLCIHYVYFVRICVVWHDGSHETAASLHAFGDVGEAASGDFVQDGGVFGSEEEGAQVGDV